MSKNQHVVPYEGKWGVRGEGNKRVSSKHGTQAEAIKAARKTAIKHGSEMLIHNRDGRIRERNSYGNDPFPPRG